MLLVQKVQSGRQQTIDSGLLMKTEHRQFLFSVMTRPPSTPSFWCDSEHSEVQWHQWPIPSPRFQPPAIVPHHQEGTVTVKSDHLPTINVEEGA